MNSILYVSADVTKAYEDESFITRIKDRLQIRVEGENFIKELGINIARIKFPPNFNTRAYMNNMEATRKIARKKRVEFAPKTFRCLDLEMLEDFQKRLFAYGVVNSIKLILRIRNKSIKSSCIVVYDAADEINSHIIYELAKHCRYCILLSNNINKVSDISDYVVANYGISPIATGDYSYALGKADFIISSRNIETDKNVWYIDNSFIPQERDNFAVNDITFSVPWQVEGLEFGFEVLGAILNQMEEKDIEASLKYNGIYLDKIKFNNLVKN